MKHGGFVGGTGHEKLGDSIEDYDYLSVLEGAGLPPKAEKIAPPLAATFFQCDKNPAAYNAAGSRLAVLILGAKSILFGTAIV